MTPETLVDAPPPESFFSRLMGVYFSPGETFKNLRFTPKAVLPLILLAVVSGVVAWAMAERIGAVKIAAQGIEKAIADGRMTQEQAAPQLEAMRKNEMLIKASFPIMGILGSVIMVMAFAGIFKLASMGVGAENTFGQLLSVTSYANLAVGLVSSLVFILLLYLKSPDEIDIQNPIGSNVGALLTMFVGKESLPKFVVAFANWIDVFSIWKIILLAIGFSAVSKRLKVGTAAGIIIALYLIAALVSATWTSMFG